MAKIRDVPVLSIAELLGETVALAYNIPLCPPKSAKKPGEVCYVVRDKPNSPPRGRVAAILLKDPQFWASWSTIRKIRERATRSLCCYVIGVVADPTGAEFQSAREGAAWSRVGFNPVRNWCFVDTEERCIRSARWIVFGDRQTWALDAELGLPAGPKTQRGKSLPQE